MRSSERSSTTRTLLRRELCPGAALRALSTCHGRLPIQIKSNHTYRASRRRSTHHQSRGARRAGRRFRCRLPRATGAAARARNWCLMTMTRARARGSASELTRPTPAPTACRRSHLRRRPPEVASPATPRSRSSTSALRHTVFDGRERYGSPERSSDESGTICSGMYMKTRDVRGEIWC